jgi:RNA polymerase subunit RPABC4/transcription elongation factor Spt4
LGGLLRSGKATRGSADRTRLAWVSLVALLVLAGSAGLLAVAFPASETPLSPTHAAAPTHLAPAQIPPTHGDLVVGPGQNYTIQPTLGGHVYYQGGNITVEPGGTLFVTNVTLSFVQYVADTGTAQERLRHIYHFLDEGKVEFYNATLTTDVQLINAYAKLNVTVTGTLTALLSSFQFPGWLFVNGSSADVTFNASTIESNPNVLGLSEPATLLYDTAYAPAITVIGGAKFNLFGSAVENLYSDNLLVNGYPRPTPLLLNGPIPLPSTGATGVLAGASDSVSLAIDWSYPAAIALGGSVSVAYHDANPSGSKGQSNDTTATLTVNYGGTPYALGTVTFKNNSAAGSMVVPFTPQLTSAITTSGLLQYLNYTGAFDTAAQISLAFSSVNGPTGTVGNPTINLTELSFQLNTSGPDFGVLVSDSEMTAVNTDLGLNWNEVGGGIYSQLPPYPWFSNKLNFTDGAVGYLANVTTPTNLTGVFGSSAILPDATSQVNFYRWAEFHIVGGNNLPLEGAQLSMYYAYDNNQANNQTATALNDIATANPAMWGYLKFWDKEHDTSSWGVSNATGIASILVASGNLTYGTLPDGIFLGGYHVGISVPGNVPPAHWFTWSVVPYPTGVALGTEHWGQPDVGPNQTFAGYVFSIRVTSASPPSSGTLDLGQQYYTTGTVAYNGTSTAQVYVYAQPTSGGSQSQVLVGLGQATANTPFSVQWYSLTSLLSSGTSYTLYVSASANGVTSSEYQIPGTFSVPAASPTTTNFFEQKLLGLPLWIWLAIAAAIVVGLAVFLMFARRQAAGKLVECGECGNLIPEEASVCPKCGAEFESDLIRCSRCASTIPADSKFCPECAAQLLGKPGEAGEEAERQGFADFTEKYRAEAKRELGENYSEGSFWDWWKRQPTYTSFSQWKLQQGQGTPRAGMTAPPAAAPTAAETMGPQSPKGGGGMGAGSGRSMADPGAGTSAPMPASAPPPAGVAPAGGSLKACPNCTKEIPPEYLVCPFCGAVTQ